MSTDFTIHVMDSTMTEEELKIFYSNHYGHKWFDFRVSAEARREVISLVAVKSSFRVYVGRVSFLKAALYDNDAFFSDPINRICDLIDDGVTVIDDAFILEVGKAMNLPNHTKYPMSDADNVIEFLREHEGEKVFVRIW